MNGGFNGAYKLCTNQKSKSLLHPTIYDFASFICAWQVLMYIRFVCFFSMFKSINLCQYEHEFVFMVRILQFCNNKKDVCKG